MEKKIIKRIACFALLACVFTAQPSEAQTKKAKSSGTKSAGIMSTVTVQSIEAPRYGNPYSKVVFTNSTRVFKLPAKSNPEYAKRLKASMDKRTPVYVMRASEQSDVIQKVVAPGTPGQKKKKK